MAVHVLKGARLFISTQNCPAEGWRGLGQLGHGELFQFSEGRARSPQGVQDTKPGPLRRVRLHRGLIQPDASPFDARAPQTRTARPSSRSLGWCRRNRQRPTVPTPARQWPVSVANPVLYPAHLPQTVRPAFTSEAQINFPQHGGPNGARFEHLAGELPR